MVQLWCAVLGEATVFPVEIPLNTTVNELQKAIVDEKKNVNNRFNVDPSTVRLYVAKSSEGTWMSHDPDTEDLLKGDVNPSYTKMLSSWRLDDDAYFGANFQPECKQIHVLVQLPQAEELVHKKCRGTWQSTKRPPVHQYDSKMKHFVLEKEDTEASGLAEGRVVLYCRQRFHEQMQFLQEAAEDGGDLVHWILGPQGTGKSVTTMAFAVTLDKSWTVTWIHVDESKHWQCVRLCGEERKTRTIEESDVDAILSDATSDHFVIVDGWTPSNIYRPVSKKCIDWCEAEDENEEAKPRRRLVFVCSSLTARKPKWVSDVEFKVWSWTKEEYLEAVADAAVLDFVKVNLDAHDTSYGEVSLDEIVETKFHYAGGCCAFMFQYPTATVRDKIEMALATLDDWARTGSASHPLVGLFPGPSGEAAVTPMISRFAATTAAMMCTMETIIKVYGFK